MSSGVLAGYLTVADKLIHTLEESLDTLSEGGNEAQVGASDHEL